MTDKIQVGALYKLKKGKHLCKIEESITRYVRVLSFVSNPLENKHKNWYVVFIYIYKEDLKPPFLIWPEKILPYNIFLRYFNIDMDTTQVNELICKLEKENKK